MFKRVFDYSYKRSRIQALGFYLVNLLLVLLIGAVTLFFLIYVTGNKSMDFAVYVGSTISFLASLYFSLVILEKKKQFKNKNMVLVACLAVPLSILGGSLLGLIPSAYLSTK